MLTRSLPIIDSKGLIPDHQFGFRQKHSTIEQVHRLVKRINVAFERKKYCSAAFLDISQAFDRVWHEGLLYKLKMCLPFNLFLLIRSYLEDRRFYVSHGTAQTRLYQILAGEPQGSVLGPILYLLFTSDLLLDKAVTTGTFADDTAVLAINEDPSLASMLLQKSINNISDWLKKWRIKVNESKSVHVTFTLGRKKCPSVTLNNIQVPQAGHVKYLEIHLNKQLTWKKHIFTKRKQLELLLRKTYWMIGRKSQLSIKNKVLIIYIKLSSNLSGPTVFNFGVLRHTPILRLFRDSNLKSHHNKRPLVYCQ